MSREDTTNIRFVGYISMKINEQILTNSIKETIRYVDSEATFDNYVKEKFKYNTGFVDVGARNLFKSKDITASVIKYAYGYNHYSIRDTIINGKSLGSEYLRYNEPETWKYVVRYQKVRSIQREFIKKTAQDLFRVNE